MVNRILELLKINDMTAKKLTDELKLSNSALTDWKKGKAKPSTEAVIKIANYFNVSTDYILTGSEYISNTSLSVDEKIEEFLLLNYRRLDKNNQKVILYLIDTMLNNKLYPDNINITEEILKGNFHQANDNKYNIKHVPILGQTTNDITNGIINVGGKKYVGIPNDRDIHYAVFSLDDSMEPEINYNDLIFIKATPTVDNLSMALVNLDGNLICRLLELYDDRVEFKPINKKYKTLIYFKNTEEISTSSIKKENYDIVKSYKIIGKVITVQDNRNNIYPI